MANNESLQTIVDRIRSLRNEGEKGFQIAIILCDEGCSIEDVRDAFYEEGYVVSIEHGGMEILHVSDQPMEAGLAVLIASSEPRALPECVWK